MLIMSIFAMINGYVALYEILLTPDKYTVRSDMAYNPNFKPILLTKEQMEVIKRIQDGERSKSPLNVAPTLNAIARGLMEKILKQEGYA